MTPTIICFNDYQENPIVQFCLSKYKSYNLLTQKDIINEINACKHSKWAFENHKWQFVGDELRLHLALQSNDFVYVDADSWVRNLDDLKMNSVCLEGDGNINDGSYFRGNKNTDWIKYYYDIYEKEDIKDIVNYDLHKKYPFTFPTQKLNYTHYYLSWFNRLVKGMKCNVVYTTAFRDRAAQEIMKGKDVVWFCMQPGDTYYSKYNAHLYQYYFIPKELFQAQLDYTAKRHVEVISLD